MNTITLTEITENTIEGTALNADARVVISFSIWLYFGQEETGYGRSWTINFPEDFRIASRNQSGPGYVTGYPDPHAALLDLATGAAMVKAAENARRRNAR